MGVNSNKQGETQLLAEWLTVYYPHADVRTHVNVGQAPLNAAGGPMPVARANAFSAWNDWADARIATPSGVFLIEATIVNTGGKYGQLLDYLDEYPSSLDYFQFNPLPVRGIVLCAFQRGRTAAFFGRYGIMTVVYTPDWARQTLETKVFRGTLAS